MRNPTANPRSPFGRALAEEERWICQRVNLPMLTDYGAGRRVYIGPCLPPLSALHYLGADARPADSSEDLANASDLDAAPENPPSPSGTDNGTQWSPHPKPPNPANDVARRVTP